MNKVMIVTNLLVTNLFVMHPIVTRIVLTQMSMNGSIVWANVGKFNQTLILGLPTIFQKLAKL